MKNLSAPIRYLVEKEFKALERRVCRIHQLIEESGAKVEWNESIPDPDNPAQSRQVDVTIRRGGFLTLVECRLHRAPQGVKWIEELIGKRVSLQADAIIAVSASGFTQGAVSKAEKFGVLLRDLHGLSDAEIKLWGAKSTLLAEYYELSEINIVLDVEGDPSEKEQEDVTAFNLLPILQVVEEVVSRRDSQIPICERISFGFQKSCSLGKMRILGGDCRLIATRRSVQINIPYVATYDSPRGDRSGEAPRIEEAEDKVVEVLRTKTKASVTFDVSKLKLPPSVVGLEMQLDMGQIMREGHIRTIGNPSVPSVSMNDVKFQFRFHPVDSSALIS